MTEKSMKKKHKPNEEKYFNFQNTCKSAKNSLVLDISNNRFALQLEKYVNRFLKIYSRSYLAKVY